MKEYPSEFTIIFFYTSTVSILAAVVGFFAESDTSKWIVGPNIALASMLCSVSDDIDQFITCFLSFLTHGILILP